MAQPKIFVSYSTKDHIFTRRLVNDLRQAGAEVWYQDLDVGGGNFAKNINIALASTEWFVAVLSKNALESKWVEQEVYAAIRLLNQERLRDIILIQAGELDLVQIPPLWGVFNIFDATPDYFNARDRVLRFIGLELLTPTSEEAIQPVHTPEHLPEKIGTVVGRAAESTETLAKAHTDTSAPYFELTSPVEREAGDISDYAIKKESAGRQFFYTISLTSLAMSVLLPVPVSTVVSFTGVDQLFQWHLAYWIAFVCSTVSSFDLAVLSNVSIAGIFCPAAFGMILVIMTLYLSGTLSSTSFVVPTLMILVSVVVSAACGELARRILSR